MDLEPLFLIPTEKHVTFSDGAFDMANDGAASIVHKFHPGPPFCTDPAQHFGYFGQSDGLPVILVHNGNDVVVPSIC